MTICLVIDIDDTLYVHDNIINQLVTDYNNIIPDYELYRLLKNINLPKYILTNATYNHANIILNKTKVINQFEKIYSRDNIPEMKPSPICYRTVEDDINSGLLTVNNGFIFFDDLLDNLHGAKKNNWITIWISPNYKEANNYKFVDKAFPTFKDALKKLNF